MRKIGPIPAAVIVASWVFGLGFAFGFEGELASNPELAPAYAEAVASGLAIGAVAVAGAGIGALGVWLATRRRRAPRPA
ncbi:hypothetical protein LQ757_14720 [Agromyces sp. SYSU K20354]|uniref:hypothetical protein n=1 Tax=Agromyces cavernae TaxID=2898659 RepID=UPI001E6406E5|nr:hypothetical protein [Agromyces cavernae]MCD2443532.1 hypothetical protein [Agromyces cavernae]